MNDWSMYLYLGMLCLAVLIVSGITLYAWRHRQVSSATAFARLLTCASIMLWGSLIQGIFALETPIASFAFSLRMLGVIVAPPTWLFFALDYSGYTGWLTRRRVLVLSIIPLLSTGLHLSNSLHHWFYRAISFDKSGFAVLPNLAYGPWFYVHSVYSYALMLVGAAILIRFALRTFRLYRLQALLLVLGACAVLIPNILGTLKITQVSYMFVGFMLMALLYGQAIFRYRLLNLAPVARHTLVDNMSDGMLVVDAQEKIVDLNPAMARFLEATAGAPIGHPVWDFLPPDADWETWLRAPAGAQATLNLARPNGSFTYDLQVSLLYDRLGHVSGRMAVLHDITERQQAAEALERYAQELESRNAELDTFAHTVAHDLKNPLSTVVGYSDYLVSRYDRTSDEKRLDVLNTITRQGQRMGSIIDELLLLASLRQYDSVALGPLNMATIVTDIMERLALAIEEKQAQIALPETWPVALGYAAWVEEIWANYLSNAIKYGGDPPHVALGWEALDGEFRFWVRDNGAGLSLEEQGRLFTPFTRLDQVSAKGHGLGLSIVRRISEKLGGQVGVTSTPGAGSTFWFTLPASEKKDTDEH
ncbi:MAG: PAS domain-containing protein [Anaerolineae bacterium]|nr:PAS domain-containing protein [Anaerolineae bacterium]